MESPKGHEPVSVVVALERLERHWSARWLERLYTPCTLLHRLGLEGLSGRYCELVRPLGDWLCDQQRHFISRQTRRGYGGCDPHGDGPMPATVLVAATSLVLAAIAARALFNINLGPLQ